MGPGTPLPSRLPRVSATDEVGDEEGWPGPELALEERGTESWLNGKAEPCSYLEIK